MNIRLASVFNDGSISGGTHNVKLLMGAGVTSSVVVIAGVGVTSTISSGEIVAVGVWPDSHGISKGNLSQADNKTIRINPNPRNVLIFFNTTAILSGDYLRIMGSLNIFTSNLTAFSTSSESTISEGEWIYRQAMETHPAGTPLRVS